MFLLKCFDLPEIMQNSEVFYYHQILEKRKASIFFKRIFDIVFSFLFLIILSPLFAIVALMVKVDSKGPVVFKQKRYTTAYRPFYIYKFRTMTVDAERNGSMVTVKDDRRITRVGKRLRKLRIDELPQLMNVLKGEMSFVGTRPEVEKYVLAYDHKMLATLLLPAGITSPASIFYKDEDRLLEQSQQPDKVYIEQILPDKMKYNLKYIEEFSFFQDIAIIFKTIFSVFLKKEKRETME